MTDDLGNELLSGLLKKVSRAFYLTLRVLPAGLREPVGLAYLLARAADTIADTTVLPAEQRLEHLLALRRAVAGGPGAAPREELTALASDQADPSERKLLAAVPRALVLLEAQPADDRRRVREIVTRLTEGMEFDLRRFPPEGSGRLAALENLDELNRYTYLVAGCVGEFWTASAVAHTPALSGWDAGRMDALGVRFGKALQLTNVLRDVPRDLRIGRCYLPADALCAAGLTAEDLLDPSNANRARPVLLRGIELALERYESAQTYVLAIPRRCVRLRLAALWPVLIGLATLSRLAANERWLDPRQPTKVSRGWIYRTIAASVPLAPSNAALGAWIAAGTSRVRRAIGGATASGSA